MPERCGLSPRETFEGRSRVLIVGTTPDYVDLLRRSHPKKCLFLTESQLRLRAKEPRPGDDEEVLYRWDKQLFAAELLRRHQDRHDMKIAGIACFDCESMLLASRIARKFHLPYPSPAAVSRCRNKYQMKQAWEAGNIPIPRFSVARRSEDAIDFFHEIGQPCIMKPLSGSGSELVFRIDNEIDCLRIFDKILAQLKTMRLAPLYRSCKEGQESILIEECVDGQEYSCDCLMEEGQVHILRLTRKYPLRNGPFGTTQAYELSPDLPEICQDSRIGPVLMDAATSLGFDRALYMVDFLVRDDQPVFLELTPRCGGDCLPFLLRTACDFDIFDLALRFARGSIGNVPICRNTSAVALRLFADRAGRLEATDLSDVLGDPRVLSATVIKQPGDLISLPPDNYDSWILGHIIYRPDQRRAVAEQNEEMTSLFRMKIIEK
ncbi:MAG: ATP-grasp domain-containing protein [Pirellulales bacterium]|nr:ATP-grasp domain-containing protein [Pirellulales bacterium]